MMLTVFSVAYAMGQGAPSGGSQGVGGLGPFVPLIAMVVIFYFLLIRPQQKKAKQHQAILDGLKRDDMVVTTGGVHGKITGLTDTIATLEIAQNVKVKVSRANIAGMSVAHVKSE
jgi:preprotein translocase subunit YajC